MSLKSSARVKPKRRTAGEGWVSYNRVLVGNMSSKKNIGRNPNFDTDETKLLIQLWGDPKVQRTLITTHKKHSVICQLATQMQEYGYYRSPEEITTRIKNLKCFYNRLKKEIHPDQSLEVEPSWRHFAEMDAIMTRPIFSVRPNEVPQPSLKYQLEQQREEREEREERRKQILDEGGTVSESDEHNEDDNDVASKSSTQDIDDGIIPDVEVDMDINDEAFAAITAGEASGLGSGRNIKITNGDIESEADEDEEDKPLQIKEETDSNNTAEDESEEYIKISDQEKPKSNAESEEILTETQAIATTDASANKAKHDGALIIPKEEPIDVDAEYDINLNHNMKTNVGELMPTLAEMLKMTKPSGSSAVINTNSTATSHIITTFSSSALTTTTASAAAAITASTNNVTETTASKIAMQAATGKISLVPASFLLQSKSATATSATTTTGQQRQLLPKVINNAPSQMQQRILLSSHGATASGAQMSSGSHATGIVTTGPGGMKVLLVNAEQTGTAGSLQQQLQQQAVGAHQQQYQQMLHNQQHQQQQEQQQEQQKESKRKLKRKAKYQQFQRTTASKNADQKDKSGVSTTTRQLIHQLHDMLEQNTDIQRQRLNIEIERLEAQRTSSDLESKRLALDRERFEFERTAFERLLGVFPSLLQKQQQTQLLHPERVSAASAKMLFNPSKLLFTTAGGAATFAANVPTINGATAVFAPSNSFGTPTLTAAVAPQQMEICTQINDLQMLKPKLEKDA